MSWRGSDLAVDMVVARHQLMALVSLSTTFAVVVDMEKSLCDSGRKTTLPHGQILFMKLFCNNTRVFRPTRP